MVFPRERVVGVLDLLASKEEQLRYQREVPIADVPAELLCTWFDDLGEVWRSKAFSQQERDRIESFHTFFASRRRQLPTSLDQLHQSHMWKEIMQEAENVLIELGWASD